MPPTFVKGGEDTFPHRLRDANSSVADGDDCIGVALLDLDCKLPAVGHRLDSILNEVIDDPGYRNNLNYLLLYGHC